MDLVSAGFDTHELSNRGDGFLIFAAVCNFSYSILSQLLCVTKTLIH